MDKATETAEVFNRDEVLGRVSELIQIEDNNRREEETTKFVDDRLKLLTDNSVSRNFSLLSAPRKGFLHPESEISRSMIVDPFMVDDTEIYKQLIKKFQVYKDSPDWQGKTLRELAPYVILDTIANYFGNKYATESTESKNRIFYMDRVSSSSESIHLNELKGQGFAVCAEKAAAAQNLLSFLGYESELIASTSCRLQSSEQDDVSGHMYNVITSGDNHVIFDPANPQLVMGDNGSVEFALPSFYPINQEQYLDLMTAGQVEVVHEDCKWDGEKILPGDQYKRVYGGPSKTAINAS